MRLILILLAMLACAAPARAQLQTQMTAPASRLERDIPVNARLLYVAESDNKAAGRSIGYHTLPEAPQADGLLAVWVIDAFVTPWPFKGKTAAYAGGLYLFDCEGRRFSLQRGALHAADGEQLDYYDSPQPWEKAQADSELALVLRNVCDADPRFPTIPTVVGLTAMLADAAKRAR
ncbi:hypothetical protein QO010_001604 [Caulobacter ginsengisoli]|uniref:Uncharacterized protein n=1 Tax=Caulobacter ginsengisoli TaxID=400775 RepID=A0ABU0IP98_9CAUL|nr:hypothetical protein [Caulobacter ginsengisoli]MDQ0463833.1 hypothetical protein [Caulobacter ginsengisoli]